MIRFDIDHDTLDSVELEPSGDRADDQRQAAAIYCGSRMDAGDDATEWTLLIRRHGGRWRRLAITRLEVRERLNYVDHQPDVVIDAGLAEVEVSVD